MAIARSALTSAGALGAWLALAAAPALIASPLPATAPPPRASPQASASANIDGTIVVSIHSPTLKHWGLPGAEAAFVPDADGSAEARAIRMAASAEALCTALERTAGHDPAIAIAVIDGDGDFEHRSGDATRLRFLVSVPRLSTPAPGTLWVCSRPVLAVVSRGNYPDERFQTAEGHRLWWAGRRLTLRPDDTAHVRLTASLDASEW